MCYTSSYYLLRHHRLLAVDFNGASKYIHCYICQDDDVTGLSMNAHRDELHNHTIYIILSLPFYSTYNEKSVGRINTQQ